jgi:hypothetical protein
MLEIGDLFLRKDGQAGRAIHSLTAIAEDHEGTKLYEIDAGYYTETQVYEMFDGVTILEEAEEGQCNPEA